MFRCDGCKELVERGVSPVTAVTATRQVEYRRRDPETKEVLVSRGWEIAQEKRLCHKCSGVNDAAPRRGINMDQIRTTAEVRQAHSQRCHRPLADCKQCQDNLRWFRGLSPREADVALSAPARRVGMLHIKEVEDVASAH